MLITLFILPFVIPLKNKGSIRYKNLNHFSSDRLLIQIKCTFMRVVNASEIISQNSYRHTIYESVWFFHRFSVVTLLVHICTSHVFFLDHLHWKRKQLLQQSHAGNFNSLLQCIHNFFVYKKKEILSLYHISQKAL